MPNSHAAPVESVLMLHVEGLFEQAPDLCNETLVRNLFKLSPIKPLSVADGTGIDMDLCVLKAGNLYHIPHATTSGALFFLVIMALVVVDLILQGGYGTGVEDFLQFAKVEPYA